MATPRNTGSSVFGAVTATAQSITSVANTLTTSISMLEDYVTSQRDIRQDLYKKEAVASKDQNTFRAAQKSADLAYEIANACKDPEYKKLYEAAVERINKALEVK